MKPFHYFLGIAGAALVFGVADGVVKKARYDADGREIASLLNQYKAIGQPTVGSDVFTPIHSDENAWADIAPLLLNKNGRGNGPLFRSAIATELLFVGKSDIFTIRKYLAINQAKRGMIQKFLDAKEKIQVPHEYDQGYMLLLPEYATMKALCKEFCLAAYAAALEDNADEMVKNLDSAKRFADHCVERHELIGLHVGVAIQRVMIDTGLRIVEEQPSMLPVLQPIFTDANFYVRGDIKKIFGQEFLAQIVTCRYLDTPLLDKRQYPAPLGQVLKAPTQEDIFKESTIRGDDYIPVSRTMRSFMRMRLERGKPFMTHLSAQKDDDSLPPLEEYANAFDISKDYPSALTFLNYGPFDAKANYDQLGVDLEYADASRNLWWAIAIKTKTGHFPLTLNEIGIPIRSRTNHDGFRYVVDGNTVQIESVRLLPDKKGPAVHLAFPVAAGLEAGAYKKNLDIVRQFKTGKINQNGPPPTFTIPPGAPRAVSPPKLIPKPKA